MKKTPAIKYLAPLAILSFLLAAQPTQAASLESATKTLDTAVKQFINAKDENSEENLSPEEDFTYRKNIVSSAIDLSIKEASATKTKLIAYDLTKDKDLNALRNQSVDSLNTLLLSYQDFSEKLDAANNVDDLKAIAKSLKDYRESTHNPIISKAIELSLTIQAGQLSSSAFVRWEKIGSDIKKLDQANLIKAKSFAELMSDAKDHIDNAEASADKARALIVAPKKEIVPETKITEVTSKEKVKVQTPRELSENSLNDLKSSYEIFLKISDSIKKSLLKSN